MDFPDSVGLYPILDYDYCKIHSISPEFLLDLWNSHKNYISFIQFRGKSLSESEYRKEYSNLRNKSPKLEIVVNDFWELAIRESAFGFHVGKEDFKSLSDKEKEALLSSSQMKGTSSHSESDLRDLANWRWDYSGIGPIFPTNTKQTDRKILGLDFLKSVVSAKIPLCPIGGISEDNLESVFGIGNFFPASISAFSDEIRFLKCIGVIKKYCPL